MKRNSKLKFKIEKKRVPIPKASRGHRSCIYPWDEMKVGDSLVIPAKARTSASNWGHRHGGAKFVTRQIEGGNYRVWRTA